MVLFDSPTDYLVHGHDSNKFKSTYEQIILEISNPGNGFHSLWIVGLKI